MMADGAAVLVPVMRRRVIEIRPGEVISWVGASLCEVRVTLIEKSGRKARVLVEAPDDVTIDTSKCVDG